MEPVQSHPAVLQDAPTNQAAESKLGHFAYLEVAAAELIEVGSYRQTKRIVQLHRAAAVALAAGLLVAAQSDDAEQHLGTGIASYYASAFGGKRTASGEPYRADLLTAAHRTAAFGSHIRVTNLANDEAVVVRVNDRGPWSHSRIIDISREAARQIGMIESGTARVRLNLVVEQDIED